MKSQTPFSPRYAVKQHAVEIDSYNYSIVPFIKQYICDHSINQIFRTTRNKKRHSINILDMKEDLKKIRENLESDSFEIFDQSKNSLLQFLKIIHPKSKPFISSTEEGVVVIEWHTINPNGVISVSFYSNEKIKLVSVKSSRTIISISFTYEEMLKDHALYNSLQAIIP